MSNLLTPGGTELQMGFPIGLTTWPVNTATSGNNSADVANTCFYASLWIPGAILITNLNFLVGATGGTDLVFGSIFDVSGNLLTSSAAAGATVGTAAQIQTLALIEPYRLDGPNFVLLGLTFNGANATLRTVPAYCGGGMVAGSVAQTFATGPASIVPSATKFTANTGPVIFLG